MVPPEGMSARCTMRASKFVMAVVAILVCIGVYDVGSDLFYRSELSNSIDEINKGLPQLIGPGVRFDRASWSPPRYIRFDYTLLGVESRNARSALADSMVEQSGRDIACHSNDASRLVRQGLTFVITFYGEDGGEISHSEYDAEKCRGGK